MKIGDTVFIPPLEAEVKWVGQVTFMAGGHTFNIATESAPVVGTHWRIGSAYSSKEAYEAWRAHRDAWDNLRYSVGAYDTPPDHLSAEAIETFLKQLKEKHES